jgi:hypothetical protein
MKMKMKADLGDLQGFLTCKKNDDSKRVCDLKKENGQ